MKIFTLSTLTLSFLFASVDINTATAKELTSLHGIGTSKAQAIVKFRKNHCFKNTKELSLVKGIGSKTLEKNMNDLTASKCKK